MAGRPTDLTPERRDKIVQVIRTGSYQQIAAAAAGISTTTFYRWMERGADPNETDPRYAEFRDAVETAKAEAEAALVATIRAAAPTNWQAAAWILERTRPDRYTRRVEHAGPGGGPVKIETTTIETLLLDAGRAEAVADLSVDAEVAALTDGA